MLSEHCSLVRGSWPHGVEVVVQDHWPPHFFVGRLAGSEMLKEMKLVLTNLVWGRCCWGLASPPIRVRRRAEREDGAARRPVQFCRATTLPVRRRPVPGPRPPPISQEQPSEANEPCPCWLPPLQKVWRARSLSGEVRSSIGQVRQTDTAELGRISPFYTPLLPLLHPILGTFSMLPLLWKRSNNSPRYSFR